MKRRFVLSLVMVLLPPSTSFAMEFVPQIGDEATYEINLPTGRMVTRRVLESFDAVMNKYEIALYQEAQGKIQRKPEWVSAADMKASYISDLTAFCQSRSGQLISVSFAGQTLQGCELTKDKGLLSQSETWIAGIPFGLFHSLKKSPLHPKAASEIQLLSFQLIAR